MPRTRTSPTPATKPKSPRSVHAAVKKPARVRILSAPVSIPEFDADAHRQDIAHLAYHNWLERADGPGSPEEDWLKAEMEVHPKHG